MFSVSACVEAKKSRLLSWPMYFWYSRGSRRGAALQRIGVPHVPVGDEIVAVGIRVDEEDDALVQETHRLVVGPADHLVDHLGELLRAEHLGRVESAVDPDDRLALPRQPARLRRPSQPSASASRREMSLYCRQVLVIGRGGDDRHQLRPAFGRLADLLQHHAVRLRVELAPVRRQSACSWRAGSRRRN